MLVNYQSKSNKHQLVNELKASQDSYLALFNSISDGIYVMDRVGEILDVNQGTLDMYGYARSEIIGQRTEIVTDLERANVEEIQNYFRQALNGQPQTFECWGKRKNGQGFPVDVKLTKAMYFGQEVVLAVARDITLRKQAERQLLASERRFRDILENVQLYNIILDLKGNIVFCNDFLLRRTGWQREEVIGQNWFEVFIPSRIRLAMRAFFQKLLEDAGKEGTPTHGENVIQHRNGEEYFVRWNVGYLRDFQGEITGFTAVGEDNTEREQALEALEESQRLNQYMLDGMVDIIGLQNPHHDVIKYNAAGYQFLGVEPGQAKGKKCFQLINSEKPCEVCATVLALKSKVPEEVEKYMPDRDLWLACRSIPILDEQGNVTYIVEQLRDITKKKKAIVALRQSEANLRSYIDQSLDGIFIYDDHGQFLEVNPAGCQLLGYSTQELMDMQIEDILSTEENNLERWQEQHQELLIRRKIKGELKFVRKTEEVIIVEVYSVALGENRNMGIARDVTERKKMEEEILKARKIESIGILAGGIAHDFNNILTVVMGNVSLAKMRLNSADTSSIARILGDVERASSQAKDLIQQLLTFAKGGAPIKQINSIEQLLRDTITFALRGTSVRCNFEFGDYLWPVEFDGGQINQVINNLIINAIQAMPEGGIIRVGAENITLTAGQLPPLKSGDYVKIYLADQGIGIPAEYLSRIFDPYFTTKQRGSGLGLATAYSIISKHDGYITVESEIGKGSSFYIYLPAAPTATISLQPQEESLCCGKGKVLLMDDEPDIREVAQAMLAQLGYEAETVNDGSEAVATYLTAMQSQQPFAAVIMDLTVPGGMGGKIALQKIKEFDPQVKAVVSSGYSNDPVMANFQDYGFSGVLSKPYKLNELGVILNQILGNQK